MGRCLRCHLISGGACGARGFPGAVGSGRCVCRRSATRPPAVCAGGRRPARPLCVPAVGDPPARCASMSHVIPLRVFQMLNSHRWDCNVLRCSLKLTVLNYVRLMFGSGPAAAHRHRGQDRALKPGQDPSLRINVARNSLAVTSNHELTSLQLQRLWTVSKSDRVKLCATYVWLGPCCRPPATRQGPAGPAAASNRAGLVAVRR